MSDGTRCRCRSIVGRCRVLISRETACSSGSSSAKTAAFINIEHEVMQCSTSMRIAYTQRWMVHKSDLNALFKCQPVLSARCLQTSLTVYSHLRPSHCSTVLNGRSDDDACGRFDTLVYCRRLRNEMYSIAKMRTAETAPTAAAMPFSLLNKPPKTALTIPA